MKQKNINNDAIFTIDLLKGQGIPPKSSPVGLLIIVSSALIPVFLAITFYGLYNNNKIVTKIKQQDVLKLEADILELSEALETKRNLDRKVFFYNTCLSEVKSSIKKYKQWSPVLAILLEEMPSSVLLKNLKVEQEKVRKNSLGTIDPLNAKDVIVTKLVLQISNREQGDYAEQVKEFRNRLYASSALSSKLENIISTREAKQNNGIETISYKIECLFKPEI
ncbi:MAG: hypothetical protein JXA96_11755 [Sedimentisphaerales bacterium]|nr:hypothetical protein [Sedimentisphaerales bacterium]